MVSWLILLSCLNLFADMSQNCSWVKSQWRFDCCLPIKSISKLIATYSRVSVTKYTFNTLVATLVSGTCPVSMELASGNLAQSTHWVSKTRHIYDCPLADSFHHWIKRPKISFKIPVVKFSKCMDIGWFVFFNHLHLFGYGCMNHFALCVIMPIKLQNTSFLSAQSWKT